MQVAGVQQQVVKMTSLQPWLPLLTCPLCWPCWGLQGFPCPHQQLQQQLVQGALLPPQIRVTAWGLMGQALCQGGMQRLRWAYLTYPPSRGPCMSYACVMGSGVTYSPGTCWQSHVG
jgi:hypothetical protein